MAIPAIIGGIASIGSALIGSRAARKAAQSQERTAMAGIEEQRRQFDVARQALAPFVDAASGTLANLSPYTTAGLQALERQAALAGLRGPEAYQRELQMIQAGPEYQAMVQQGEEALLSRASATGGLRGGNIQAALAQFRPQVLSSLVNQRYGQLGGLAGAGMQTSTNIAQLAQAAGAGQASGAIQTGANIGNLLSQVGAAQAGSALAQGQIWGKTAEELGKIAGRWWESRKPPVSPPGGP
jgi:hypothetical protein